MNSEGLEYLDENGIKQFIPRCNEQNKYAYKYTIEKKTIKDSYCKILVLQYPEMDKFMIEILVDSYLNHPDIMNDNMYNDKDYMKNIILS